MAFSVKKFIAYLWAKKGEVQRMDHRDGLLAKVVLDIHRKRSHSTFLFVPLFSLQPIHPINRPESLQGVADRTEALRRHHRELLSLRRLDKTTLNRIIPSVSAIKVVQEGVEAYIAFEGNGRLAALKQVFTPEECMELEVECYHFPRPAKILKRMNRVRQSHGLVNVPNHCPETNRR